MKENGIFCIVGVTVAWWFFWTKCKVWCMLCDRKARQTIANFQYGVKKYRVCFCLHTQWLTFAFRPWSNYWPHVLANGVDYPTRNLNRSKLCKQLSVHVSAWTIIVDYITNISASFRNASRIYAVLLSLETLMLPLLEKL